MSNDHPLSQQEFDDIYARVPRLTVEIIIASGEGVYLTQRNIEPCKGMWHLPGGTVRFGERLTEAVARITERELGVGVASTELLGYIEYPSHFEKELDSPVGIAFFVRPTNIEFKASSEASDAGWFKKLPSQMHSEQSVFLYENYLVEA